MRLFIRILFLTALTRYLFYMVEPNALVSLPLVDPDAVDKGIEELVEDYKGSSVIKDIKGALIQFTVPGGKGEQGILLYGPPGEYFFIYFFFNVEIFVAGTGKTDITSKLAKRVGLTEVSPPLASSELNRSLVGETERILIDLFERATKVNI